MNPSGFEIVQLKINLKFTHTIILGDCLFSFRKPKIKQKTFCKFVANKNLFKH